MPGTLAAAAKRGEARIKMLCYLGLPAGTLMPALVGEVRAIIPCYSVSFFWADETGALANIYDEHPDTPKIEGLYIEGFYNPRERELYRSFSWKMRHDVGVLTRDRTLSVRRGALLNSNYYNLPHRPLRYDEYLRLMVSHGGRPLGALMVWRAPGDPPFTAMDARWLARLEPFIAHALADPVTRDVPLAESNDSGLVLATRDGKLLHLSSAAQRLLFLARQEAIAPGVAMERPTLLPAPVVCICRALSNMRAGKAGVPPFRWRCRNRWGGFVFCAYPLEGPGPASGLIGITITREEPLAVRLINLVQGLALTRRQTEVCVQLAQGHSTQIVAQNLGLSEHTVIAHERWIYRKLDIHNRVELMNQLLLRARNTDGVGPRMGSRDLGTVKGAFRPSASGVPPRRSPSPKLP